MIDKKNRKNFAAIPGLRFLQNIWHKTSSKFTMFDFKTFMASKLLRNILLHRYCILQHGNAFLIGIFIAFGIDKVELIRWRYLLLCS